MIFVIIGIVLGLALLLWIWKVPIKKSVDALRKNGSSTFEAYFLVFLMVAGSAVIIYLLGRIV